MWAKVFSRCTTVPEILERDKQVQCPWIDRYRREKCDIPELMFKVMEDETEVDFLKLWADCAGFPLTMQLEFACQNNNPKVWFELLYTPERDGIVRSVDLSERYLYYILKSTIHPEIAQHILRLHPDAIEWGCEFNNKTPIMCSRSMEMFRFWLSQGANVYARSKNPVKSLLEEGFCNGCVEIVDEIIEAAPSLLKNANLEMIGQSRKSGGNIVRLLAKKYNIVFPEEILDRELHHLGYWDLTLRGAYFAELLHQIPLPDTAEYRKWYGLIKYHDNIVRYLDWFRYPHVRPLFPTKLKEAMLVLLLVWKRLVSIGRVLAVPDQGLKQYVLGWCVTAMLKGTGNDLFYYNTTVDLK